MALTPQQRGIARLIYGIGTRRGLSPARARELVAASYAESSLDPQAVNRSSGAAGLFQLLSSGYRQRAQQLGGLHNPRANLLAILPDYLSYWRSHPQAAPGEAGRDVERSGEGAGFYSAPLGILPAQLGGLDGTAGLTAGGAARARAVPPSKPSGPSSQLKLAQALIKASRSGDYGGFFEAVRDLRTQRPEPTPAVAPAPAPAPARTAGFKQAKPMGGLAEAFYDPLGSYDSGSFGGPIGGHSDHVHLSITNPGAMLTAINQAQRMGMRVSENPYVDPVDPVHVRGSFHYQSFPRRYRGKRLGEAIDVSGTPAQMAALYRWATNTIR